MYIYKDVSIEPIVGKDMKVVYAPGFLLSYNYLIIK